MLTLEFDAILYKQGRLEEISSNFVFSIVPVLVPFTNMV